MTTKYAAHLKLFACGLAVFASAIEVGLNFASKQPPGVAGLIALGAGIATACAFGALGWGPQTAGSLILLPLLAGAITAVVDLVLQAECAARTGNFSRFSVEHTVAVGLASVGISAGGAVLGAISSQFEVALGSAILSGDAAGIADLINQGGACG